MAEGTGSSEGADTQGSHGVGVGEIEPLGQRD